jgi:hypothetical protein
MGPVLKLGAVMVVSLPICAAMLHFARQRSLAVVSIVAVAGILGLMIESYFVFGLKEVWEELRHRMQSRAIEIT